MKRFTSYGNPITWVVKFCKKCRSRIKDMYNDYGKSGENKEQSKEESFVENQENFSSQEIKDPTYNNLIEKKGDLSNNKGNNKNKNNEYINSNYIIREDLIREDLIREDLNSRYMDSEDVNSKYRNMVGGGSIPKIATGVVLIVAILVGVFFNKLKGEYYIIKAKDAVNATEKFDYATKAVKILNISETKDLLKTAIGEIAQNDVELAEEKLDEVKNMLSEKDCKDIAVDIKDKKIDRLYKDGKYQDAVSEFDEIDNLGGNFKSNKNYEEIMLNVISNITNTSLSNTKSLLMKDNKICFDNFDDDPYDEIIEVKSDSSKLKINLYKFKNGQYKLVDSKIMDGDKKTSIEGVYDYATDKKGVFINYKNVSNNSGTSVFGVSNDKLQQKGAVLGNNYTKPDDVDNDGIYEVLSNSTSIADSSNKDNSKWYKIYEDGRTPTEVNTSGEEKFKINTNLKDYIFVDSDKRYLTEADMKSISKDQLAFARNEIFARHGYVFKMDQFKKYFATKSWYVPNYKYDDSGFALNKYEVANYKLIQEWEKK